MGEAKRRRAAVPADVLVVAMEGDPHARSIPPGTASALACQIGVRGQPLEQAVTAADFMVSAAAQQPGALIMLSVEGWDDDPREVPDIPEAAALFRTFGERLVAIGDRAFPVARRLDTTSRALLAVCMDLAPRSHLEVVTLTEEEKTARLRADIEAAREVG